jgi:hypothetical protein
VLTPAAPISNQVVNNVVIQKNTPQIIQSQNGIVNQAQVNAVPPQPIQVASNNNINLQSQNRVKTEQQIPVLNQRNQSEKQIIASSASVPPVPSNTQVTIPPKQVSQTTIISNQNKVLANTGQAVNKIVTGVLPNV